MPSTTVSLSSPPLPYACVKRRRERRAARAQADEATTDGDPGMDAGDADVEDVVVALDDDRVVAAFSLRAALRRRRATDVSDAGRSRGCCSTRP